MGDIAADLDKLSEEGEAKAEGRKPGEKRVDKPPVAPPKPAPGAKPPEGGDKPPEGDKPPAAPESLVDGPEPVKVSDLRTAHTALRKKVKEDYEPKIQTLEARIKELEVANPPEVKALQERLTAAEKRRDELESEIVYVNYAKSKEFDDKYARPYREAWADALRDLKQLPINEEGRTREATEDDLLELANLPLGQARQRAIALFGDSADDIMMHRRKIIDLSNAQAKALEDQRTAGLEKAKTAEAEMKGRREKTLKLWTESNTAIVKKWPHMFDKVEGDQEGNDLLDKGEALADRLFSPTEENRPKSEEEAVRLHALMRQKIRNHDRLALWLKKANAKIKELEKALEDFEKSGPTGGLGGDPNGKGTADFMEDANAEIDRMDKA